MDGVFRCTIERQAEKVSSALGRTRYATSVVEVDYTGKHKTRAGKICCTDQQQAYPANNEFTNSHVAILSVDVSFRVYFSPCRKLLPPCKVFRLTCKVSCDKN